MTDPKAKISYEQARDAGLDDWRWLLGGLHARFATGDFVTGIALADEIAKAAEEANHHPDLDLRYPFLAVKLVSHDVGGVTDRDLQLARRISELAAAAGVAADPASVQVLELALDTPDIHAILPFWAAVLDFKQHGDAPEVIDPDGRITTLWFQKTRTARRAPAAVPPRHRRTDRAGAGADRRSPGGRRDDGHRRARTGVLGARRRRRQQGLRLHSGGPHGLSPGLIGCWDRHPVFWDEWESG